MSIQTIPDGYATVTPWIISPDTDGLLDYLHRAFGAEELDRFVTDEGVIGHAETRIGDAVVMAFDARPDWPPTPAFLRLSTSRTRTPPTAPPSRRAAPRSPR